MDAPELSRTPNAPAERAYLFTAPRAKELLLYRQLVVDPDETLPASWRIGVAVALILMLVAGGIVVYRTTHPCWPWEETGSFAGGTTCDGKQARFETD